MPWEDYTAKLAVRVKWMSGNVRMPDAALEIDDEVRASIEFMAERGYKDHFSVACYLTTKTQAEDIDAEPQDDGDGFDTAE